MRNPETFIGSDSAESRTRNSLVSPPKLPNYRDTCLPVSLILGYFHQGHLRFLYTRKEDWKEHSNNFKKLNLLLKNSENTRGIAFLTKCFLNLCTDLDLPFAGPYPMVSTVEKICQYFGCACRIVNREDLSIVLKYPGNVSIERPEVVLLLSKGEEDRKERFHVDLVTNPTLYFKVS